MKSVGENKQLHYYRLSANEVIARLHSTAKGLRETEAAERLEQMGANTLDISRGESWIITFLRQFRDLMIVLLLVSAGLRPALYSG